MFDVFRIGHDIDRPNSGVVADLLSEALALLDNDRAGARSRIEHARALAAQKLNAARNVSKGLAPWQLKRVETYVRANINRKIRLDEVANQINSAKVTSRGYSRQQQACHFGSF